MRVAVKPERWIVIGRHGDYIVIPGSYCSCPGFQAYVWGRVGRPCYHLVAVELARRSGGFTDLAGRLDPDTLSTIVYEATGSGRSPTLRRILQRVSGRS